MFCAVGGSHGWLAAAAGGPVMAPGASLCVAAAVAELAAKDEFHAEMTLSRGSRAVSGGRLQPVTAKHSAVLSSASLQFHEASSGLTLTHRTTTISRDTRRPALVISPSTSVQPTNLSSYPTLPWDVPVFLHGLRQRATMNSLNILSARVSPTSSPAPSRTNSLGHVGLASVAPSDEPVGASDDAISNEKTPLVAEPHNLDYDEKHEHTSSSRNHCESTPLLQRGESREDHTRSRSWRSLPARITLALVDSLRFVISTITAPGIYLVAWFYDEQGNFAPLRQLGKLFGQHRGDAHKLAAEYHEAVALGDKESVPQRSGSRNQRSVHSSAKPYAHISSGSSSSGLSSDSESELASRVSDGRRGSGSNTRHNRTKSLQDTEEIAPQRRSIRIKLHSDDGLRQRKHKRTQSNSTNGGGEGATATEKTLAHLKSPTSPAGALTKYPRTPAPPRPLIPRRQPSYVPPTEMPDVRQMKTLILDLDETLIHSMSRGGRTGSGHMIEVRLNTTYVANGGQQSLGPQHPILYYVHKRPHCDEFLRKICKWFNLVVFTASVQEYADPVIDWLESERKFFSARYYRQHCTFRHGAFIKDLSFVEPDLSKVMILDNSPLSYMFHQDNAIPIQGWISDPTDNDLLHLVPFLEGLQYVSDVRALLALRGGEDGQMS
ncbi:NLI interacting factor-like phosphatase-domain-containing protein [Microdochium trichocladiopsis]|uniref:NLI interacting factor-like phosphatase-domain-containing protein n=1 Tax=Microdochium trichocladiopsis TaxID=1682393 RepID=A0A9P9BM76_9PEZI|nr:NLI interacting factor-like phosphatase-domain-containing protein [Microdochium trichocladiopsis]KAH7026008.1 NLI interacting factor-like phosphatase-domain-containing protein [Microdochium trichocladiopsis]